MTTITTFIKRRPLLTYFALTLAISWGGILLVIGGPGGIPGTCEQTEMLFPIALMVMLAGPSVVGILMTGLANGRAGVREFLSRLLRWLVFDQEANRLMNPIALDHVIIIQYKQERNGMTCDFIDQLSHQDIGGWKFRFLYLTQHSWTDGDIQ